MNYILLISTLSYFIIPCISEQKPTQVCKVGDLSILYHLQSVTAAPLPTWGKFEDKSTRYWQQCKTILSLYHCSGSPALGENAGANEVKMDKTDKNIYY